jgi:hypothetical protein
MLEIGKLYRVSDYAVSDEAQHQGENEHVVENHGWLWIYEGNPYPTQYSDSNERFWLRSVATGEELWFEEEELEVADAEEG